MHEQSETVGQDGNYFNLSGLTKRKLDPFFSFERDSYPGLRPAVDAAEMRSYMQGPGGMDLNGGANLGALIQPQPDQQVNILDFIKRLLQKYPRGVNPAQP